MKKLLNNKIPLIITLFAITLLYVVLDTQRIKNESDNLVPIRISVSRTPLSAPFYVAKKLGYFEENGIHVELLECVGGNESFKHVMSGHADYGTSSESVLMFAAFEDISYSNLASFVESSNDLKLLIRADKNLSIESLKGKKIGIIPKSASEYYLSLILGLYHLKVDDVELVKVSPNKMADALDKNIVDAAVTWEPYAFEIKKILGDKIQFLDSGQLYTLYFNLIARQNYAKTNLDTSKKLLSSLNQAITFIYENPQKTKVILMDSLSLDENFIDWTWPDYFYHLSLNRSLMLTLKDEAKWVIQSKISNAKSIPDFNHFVDARALREVDPSAVSIEQ